ncbi:MAG: SUMF1/EgtB/PvdO family nonheme iron enzyme [Waterburya sp.]
MVKKSEIQIFLAHANEDKRAVLELYERLKEAGYKPWLDKKDLIPGQNWRSVIPQAIAKSQLFIACLSQRSIAKRGFVQKEFKLALNKYAEMPQETIYIIPLRLDECEIPDLRQDEYGLNLRDIQWLDYWEADGLENLERAIAYQYGPFAQAQSFTQDLGNGINLEMIAIPGGTFMMGTEDEEIERLLKKYNTKWLNSEKPQHKVTVPPFFMGKYPVTQAQWKAISSRADLKVERDLDPNPAYFTDREDSDRRPVERVSWDDAVEFCLRLSKQTGKEYRLPTEAEWEYACRAGTTTPYHFGETITDKLANYGSNIRETTLVGQFPPNAFGLYDMHGNVREWCLDDWHENYIGAPTDGSAWFSKESSMKVLRGGSWADYPRSGRSAYRVRNEHDRTFDRYGFRVACVALQTT